MSLITKNSFTLLEVVIAMAILSVIVTAIYTSFRGGTDSWTKGRDIAEITQNARMVLEIMSREISSAIISPYTDLNDTDNSQDLVFVGQDNGNSDILNFTAMLRSPDSSNKYAFGLVEIGYSHDANNTIERRIDTTAIWDSLGVADSDPLIGGALNEMGYNITELNFEYWDTISGSFKTQWDTRLSSEPGCLTPSDTYDDDKLPPIVKVTITVTDSNTTNTRTYSTQIYLPGSEVF